MSAPSSSPTIPLSPSTSSNHACPSCSPSPIGPTASRHCLHSPLLFHVSQTGDPRYHDARIDWGPLLLCGAAGSNFRQRPVLTVKRVGADDKDDYGGESLIQHVRTLSALALRTIELSLACELPSASDASMEAMQDIQ